jgi:hypothetical protein
LKNIPNLLLFCGSGRHIGKTALLCSIISEYHQQYKITAIKISPNFHTPLPAEALIEKGEGYNVYIEKEISDKDSSLFLQAGAARSFYIETDDEHLEKAFNAIYRLTAKDELIVCESGKLRRHVKPGLMVYVHSYAHEQLSGEKDLNKQYANLDIDMDDSDIIEEAKFFTEQIIVKNWKWRLK